MYFKRYYFTGFNVDKAFREALNIEFENVYKALRKLDEQQNGRLLKKIGRFFNKLISIKICFNNKNPNETTIWQLNSKTAYPFNTQNRAHSRTLRAKVNNITHIKGDMNKKIIENIKEIKDMTVGELKMFLEHFAEDQRFGDCLLDDPKVCTAPEQFSYYGKKWTAQNALKQK